MSHPGRREFVAMMAMLVAMVALSIDAMLPALPQIAAALTPQEPNHAQLVITAFVFGMGLGTLVLGPISDSLGRKPVLLSSGVIYALGAALSAVAPSLPMLLAARALQGLGAAGPRSVGTALVRDLFKGREMAQTLSFIMMIFTLVPALAPLMGQGIMALAGWRAIFLAFVVFDLAIYLWFGLRQPETLPQAARRPLGLAPLIEAARLLFSNRIAMLSLACQTLTLGCLFSTLSSIQGIFAQAFDRASGFPLWFGLIAACAMAGSFTNSRQVLRRGMRSILSWTYGAQVGLSLCHLGVLLLWPTGPLAFPVFMLWAVGLFAMMGLTMGNLSALAMEDLGQIAGFAASIITAVSTLGSVALAVPVGLAFDGTPRPLVTGVLVFAAAALALMRAMPGPRTQA